MDEEGEEEENPVHILLACWQLISFTLPKQPGLRDCVRLSVTVEKASEAKQTHFAGDTCSSLHKQELESSKLGEQLVRDPFKEECDRIKPTFFSYLASQEFIL